MKKLLDFLGALEDKHIYYQLSRIRDSVMVEISVPGERWEVEFFEDGHVEVEKFLSEGTIWPESELDVLFAKFSV